MSVVDRVVRPKINGRYFGYAVALLLLLVARTSLGTIGLFVAVIFGCECLMVGLRFVDMRFEPSPGRLAFRKLSIIGLSFLFASGISVVGLLGGWQFSGLLGVWFALVVVGLFTAAYTPNALFGGSTPGEDAALMRPPTPDSVNPYEFLMLPSWRYDPVADERKRIADENAIALMKFKRWAFVGVVVGYGLYFIHGRNPAYLTGLGFYGFVAEGVGVAFLFAWRFLKNRRRQTVVDASTVGGL